MVSTEKLNNLLDKLENDKVYNNHDDNFEEDDELTSPCNLSKQSIEDRPKLRKCSSLKTNKTPPTSPGHLTLVIPPHLPLPLCHQLTGTAQGPVPRPGTPLG